MAQMQEGIIVIFHAALVGRADVVQVNLFFFAALSSCFLTFAKIAVECNHINSFDWKVQ